MTYFNNPLEYRKKYRGMIGVNCKIPIKDESILRLVYTPGVAEPCLKIAENPYNSFKYTCRGNTVAIISDGSRVLGLGNLGANAAIPVLEGKSVILKTFAGIDAIPICINTQDTEQFIKTVTSLAPTFGAICLEGISSPKCFTIQHHLREAMRICVFHNNQHASGVEVLAGLMNAAKIVNKKLKNLKIVICGAGAAGIAVSNILLQYGFKDIIICDKKGIIHKRRVYGMNWAKLAIARKTNLKDKKGDLRDALKGADVLIGFSVGNIISPEMIESMAKDPIVFSLAVPEPEIKPEDALKAGAKIVATGRVDSHNKIYTTLLSPGFFRGILDTAATSVNFSMLLAAAKALAALIPEDQLNENNIIPKSFDFNIAPTIAEAVAEAANKTGESNIKANPKNIRKRLESYIYEGHFPTNNIKMNKNLSVNEQSLALHEKHRGIIEIRSKITIKDSMVLDAMFMPPGASLPPAEIAKNPKSVYDLTCKGNMVAVISDGSAVLGLGDIGPWAALPVMEGKCALFHTLAGVEAIPICLASKEPDEMIELIKNISPILGGINLEDISAPRCFEIESRLKKALDIPVFHDDQHGTAIVVLAGITNALKIVGKKMKNVRFVISGAGAAGMAITKLLFSCGAKDSIMCDRSGIIYTGRKNGMNHYKTEISKMTNPQKLKGGLETAIKGADVFIGVSAPGLLTPKMIKSMNKDSIIFALANPVPEIMPDEAKKAGAIIVATGRSDFPNQVNNSLIFPGLFRGLLDTRAIEVNQEIKIGAAKALAGIVNENQLIPDYIIPNGLDYSVSPLVAAAAARAAIKTKVARIKVNPDVIEENTRKFIYEGELPA